VFSIEPLAIRALAGLFGHRFPSVHWVPSWH
jgi:hypothetical protein